MHDYKGFLKGAVQEINRIRPVLDMPIGPFEFFETYAIHTTFSTLIRLGSVLAPQLLGDGLELLQRGAQILGDLGS